VEPTTIALQAVGGFLVGSLIGYALRKVTKAILVAIGIMLLPVFGLWYLGVIEVNYEKLTEYIERIVGWFGMNISNISVATSVFGVCWTLGLVFGFSAGFRHMISPVKCYRFVRRKKVGYGCNHGNGGN